jgi:uncharacterized RDD family membrane protein YckC
MNDTIVQYLQENKDAYSKETLVKQLLSSGYTQSEIDEAIAVVYNGTNATGAVAPDGPTTVRYAGFWIRFVALIIDGIVYALLFYVPLFGISLIVEFFLTSELGTVSALSQTFLTFMQQTFSLALLAGYYYLLYKYQASPGKMAVGIIIVDEDGRSRLTLREYMVRELIGKMVSGFTFGIGYLMVAFMDKKQGLHDIIAKTTVVYKQK